MAEYPHIHIRDLGHASKEFQPHTADDEEGDPRPVPNRRRHASDLNDQLDEAAMALAEVADLQRFLGMPRKKCGIAITAQAREGEKLRVGEIKLVSNGLKLLSLKRTKGQPDVGTFFVTRATLDSMSKQIATYGEYRGGRKPHRFKLWESAAHFRVASIADLWTGEADRNLEGKDSIDWEIWVRAEFEHVFLRCLERLEIENIGTPTRFVDTVIFNVHGGAHAIEQLVRTSASVVELRSSSSFVSEYLEFDPEERSTALDEVIKMVTAPPRSCPRTLLLDTGVNYANPLVGVAIDAADCKAIDATWGVNDHTGHGTHMAAIALYGDLEKMIEAGDDVQLHTRLESIVISAPEGAVPVPAHEALRRAVALLPDDGQSRVLCLAQTAPADLTDGRQSPLSAVVDGTAWNDGIDTRLICVAAGNAQLTVDSRLAIGPYDNRNADHKVESPGQAVNALTVGACTHKLSDDWYGLAEEGDLSPTSRTSQLWNTHYAYKPDIVMEGGNHELDGDLPFSFPTKETMILTAGRNYPSHPFAWTGETSAATARAAGLATRLKAAYPDFRAETLRGMMVHSAEWTSAMRGRLDELKAVGLSDDNANFKLLQTYGWGVPNESRLFRSAHDALTLIAEDELVAYREGASGKPALAEMRYFYMPWPADALRALDQMEVELRVTLSYFAEPNPHAASRDRRDRYPSHRLRFEVKDANVSHLEAQARINKLASEDDVFGMDDDDAFGVRVPPEKGWILRDRARRRGTLHHDIWRGPAHELVERDGISVYPVRGWWSERLNPSHIDRAVRFTLIASIRAVGASVDLHTSAMANVRSGTSIVRAPIVV